MGRTDKQPAGQTNLSASHEKQIGIPEERSSAERHARLQAILDTAVDGIVTIDRFGTVLTMNPAASRLFQYAPQEVLGRNVSLLMPQPYAAEHDSYLQRYIETGHRKIIGIGREVIGRRKDGSTFPMHLGVSEVLIEPRIFVGIIRDLTEFRAAEESATELGRILEDSLNEIYIFDADKLQFQFANCGACDNLQYPFETLATMTPLDIKPDYHWEAFQELLLPLRTGSVEKVELETRHRRRDGSDYWVKINLQLSQFRGKPAFVAIAMDTTDRKFAEDALAELNTELENRVERRTRELRDAQQELVERGKLATLGQLAGSVAHEIRNPLGIIRNATYYIRSQTDSEKTDSAVLAALDELDRASSSANRIISELLDFARHAVHVATRVDLRSVIDQTLHDAGVPPGVTVQIAIADPAPTPLADADQVSQILRNLVENACQAMEGRGSLQIDCRAEREGRIAIEIRDSGPGIAAADLEQIFKPLYSRKVKGIGLGLAISRRYAELNNGKLTATSSLGDGATFRLLLPSEAETDTATKQPQPETRQRDD